jgi:hypothetical protein
MVVVHFKMFLKFARQRADIMMISGGRNRTWSTDSLKQQQQGNTREFGGPGAAKTRATHALNTDEEDMIERVVCPGKARARQDT